MASGPLDGLRILEIAGIGPGPFCGMMLADHGAEVIRIDRPGGIRGGVQIDRATDVLARSRRSLVLDLKTPAGVDTLLRLSETADGLIEGFRPGVMERLGLGPEEIRARNRRLVYGRMTGWGQEGSYAASAGHDINYTALVGALSAFGRAGALPTPPANLIGDFAGGGMMLAFGMVCALHHARISGEGQVVDCAMIDGASLLMSFLWSLRAQGAWSDERGSNELDTGAPYYDVYACADGGLISIGAIEPQFYAELRTRLGLATDPDFDARDQRDRWPGLKAKLTALFLSRTRGEWCRVLEHTDACFAPVLSLAEAPAHPHLAARGAFIEIGGVLQPAPAPRYSATPVATPRPPPTAGADSEALLAELAQRAGPTQVGAEP